LFTSCSCIQLESQKRSFAVGERAILTLRNIRPTPTAGQMYAVFVQVTSPVRTTLRFDTFVQSGSSSPTPGPGSSAPIPAVADHPPLRRQPGGPAVLVDNELERLGELESTGDMVRTDPDADAEARKDGEEAELADKADEEVEIPGLNSPLEEEPIPSAPPALDDLPQLAGIPPSGSAAEPRVAGDPPETDAGADARDRQANTPGRTEDAAAETAANVDTARQAMDDYFRQGEEEPGAGTADLAVATDIDGDIPDFYAHVPAAPSAANPAKAEADLDAAVRAASGLDPTLGMRGAAQETGAPAAGTPLAEPPERDPNARKPVQAVSLITVGVRDMADSIRFYEALGWHRAAQNKYDQTAFFQLQGQVLALYPIRDQLREQNMPEASPAPGGITLALHVQDKADVWAVYQRFMDAGGKSLRQPVEMPSGAVTSYVADPDGNPWEISWVPQFRIDEEGGLWLP
ncbi:MAG: VOC family protein, partial [Planctomycetota bacterium]|nr:VOC family protein [Planctomycetota bacterium]